MKSKRISTRATDKTVVLLESLSTNLEKSQADIISEALSLYRIIYAAKIKEISLSKMLINIDFMIDSEFSKVYRGMELLAIYPIKGDK